ncbi:hypothetical protein niasHS_001643 [Heterodera schachtii]|uniref:Uncharacterized protein n=1 Tax=Heterodera schachtii TaxID=97005 RepID=A0ABD2KEQ2_HETSC
MAKQAKKEKVAREVNERKRKDTASPPGFVRVSFCYLCTTIAPPEAKCPWAVPMAIVRPLPPLKAKCPCPYVPMSRPLSTARQMRANFSPPPPPRHSFANGGAPPLARFER